MSTTVAVTPLLADLNVATRVASKSLYFFIAAAMEAGLFERLAGVLSIAVARKTFLLVR